MSGMMATSTAVDLRDAASDPIEWTIVAQAADDEDTSDPDLDEDDDLGDDLDDDLEEDAGDADDLDDDDLDDDLIDLDDEYDKLDDEEPGAGDFDG